MKKFILRTIISLPMLIASFVSNAGKDDKTVTITVSESYIPDVPQGLNTRYEYRDGLWHFVNAWSTKDDILFLMWDNAFIEAERQCGTRVKFDSFVDHKIKKWKDSDIITEEFTWKFKCHR